MFTVAIQHEAGRPRRTAEMKTNDSVDRLLEHVPTDPRVHRHGRGGAGEGETNKKRVHDKWMWSVEKRKNAGKKDGPDASGCATKMRLGQRKVSGLRSCGTVWQLKGLWVRYARRERQALCIGIVSYGLRLADE